MWRTTFTESAESRRASLAVLLLAGFCACADAPAQERARPPLKLNGDEVVDTQERISGGAVAGVTFEPTSKVVLHELWAYFGGEGDDGVSEVRVQITTVDGRYLGTFATSEVQDPPIKGWALLEPNIERQNREFLESEYKNDEIAVLVTSEAPGEEAVKYPARWGGCGLAENEYVRVFVNAEGADAIFEVFESNGEWQQPACHDAGPSSFKFDRICRVPVSHFQIYDNVEILRKRGARYARPIVVKVPLLTGSDGCPAGEITGGGS